MEVRPCGKAYVLANSFLYSRLDVYKNHLRYLRRKPPLLEKNLTPKIVYYPVKSISSRSCSAADLLRRRRLCPARLAATRHLLRSFLLRRVAHLNRGGRRLCTTTISKTSLSTQQQNKPLLPQSYTGQPSTSSSSIYSRQTSLPPKLRLGGRWHSPLKPTSRHRSLPHGDRRRIPRPQRSA